MSSRHSRADLSFLASSFFLDSVNRRIPNRSQPYQRSSRSSSFSTPLIFVCLLFFVSPSSRFRLFWVLLFASVLSTFFSSSSTSLISYVHRLDSKRRDHKKAKARQAKKRRDEKTQNETGREGYEQRYKDRNESTSEGQERKRARRYKQRDLVYRFRAMNEKMLLNSTHPRPF